MRIGEFSEFLVKAMQKRKRVLVKGPPGVGKTFSHAHACKQLGWDYIPVCTPLQSPVKIGGYPRPPAEPGGDATHALFDGIAAAFRATKSTYLVFDDLGMAGGETLKCALDLVQFGRIDNRTLPDCVLVGAATNDVGHGADVQGLIEPLKTRWHTIVAVEPHIDDTIVYGLAAGWPADLLAYLRNSPQALHDWKPTKSIAVDGACPRGWEYCAEWVNDGITDPEVLAGCVGKGRATEYLAFRDLQAELPDVDQILMDPKGTQVPENPSARFLVSMALATRLTADNMGQVIQYTHRMPKMFQAYSIRDAFRAELRRKTAGNLPKGWKPLAGSRDFTAWATSEDGKAVMSAAA